MDVVEDVDVVIPESHVVDVDVDVHVDVDVCVDGDTAVHAIADVHDDMDVDVRVGVDFRVSYSCLTSRERLIGPNFPVVIQHTYRSDERASTVHACIRVCRSTYACMDACIYACMPGCVRMFVRV